MSNVICNLFEKKIKAYFFINITVFFVILISYDLDLIPVNRQTIFVLRVISIPCHHPIKFQNQL
jgi:hypothetical protein